MKKIESMVVTMVFHSDMLSDVKVLDLSRIFTGPYCTQILADLGADVIKVEPPFGDDTRRWGPPFVEDNLSSYFVVLNRNKRSIVLDLKSKVGKQVLEKLIKWCDVLVENFRPGVTKRLGITPEEVWAINPKVVYLSITAFGSEGPYRDRIGYDIIAQSESGLMSITGSDEKHIAKVGVPVADIAAGMYGVIGVLSALRYVARTGKGVHVETSLFGSLNSWLTYQAANSYAKGENLKPYGTAHPNIVPYQSFLCKHDTIVTIAVGNDKHWALFCEAIGHPELIEDERFKTNADRVRHRDQLIPILEAIMKEKTSDEWVKLLTKHGVPVGKVNGMLEVINHPQVQHAKAVDFVKYENRELEVPIFMTPLEFSVDHEGKWKRPPRLNEHKNEILQELGIADEDLEPHCVK